MYHLAIYKNINTHVKFALSQRVARLVIVASLFAFPVYAKVEVSAEEKVALPPPNLTVNFTLNSSLTPAHSKYYKEIVEELLRNLPKRLALQGEHRTLVTGEPGYDKMKVIVYTPKDDSEVINDIADKNIQYFEIEFEVPEQLMDMETIDGVAPELLESAIVVKKTERLEDFMKKVDMVRDGGELALPNKRLNLDLSVTQQQDQSRAVEGGSVSLSSFEQELARIAKEGKAALKKSAVVKVPVTQDVTKAAMPVAKPQKPQMNKQPMRTEKLSALEKELTVRYFGDAVKPLAKQNEALKKFAQSLKDSGASKVRLTSYTAPAVAGQDSLFAQRMHEVKNVLRSEGVAPESITFSEIRLQSTVTQALEFEVVE